MIGRVLAELRAEAPVLAGSAAVVLLMVAVAFALGFRRSARLDAGEMARLAAQEGAVLEAAVIAPDGRAGLGRLAGGKLLVARVMGADVSARTAPAGQVALRLEGGRLSATFGDLGYPPLNMRLADSPAWLAELAAGGGGRP